MSALAAFEAGSGGDSLLVSSTELYLFDLSGFPMASFMGRATALAAARSELEARYVAVRAFEGWSQLRVYNDQGQPGYTPYLHREPLAGADAGDLDGDQRDELVVVSAQERAWLIRDPLEDSGTCLLELWVDTVEPIQGLALGDLDGDGDDELALRFANSVRIFDGG